MTNYTLLLYVVAVLVNILPAAPLIQCWWYHNSTQQTQTQHMSALFTLQDLLDWFQNLYATHMDQLEKEKFLLFLRFAFFSFRLDYEWPSCGCCQCLYSTSLGPSLPINSSLSSCAYMRQWIGPALVQIMVCCLFGTNLLSKPTLGYCQLGP